MYEAIMASGWDNVLHEVIERVDTREEALARERYYILQYKSNEPEYGFNTITNLTSCGTEEEILAHRRAYNRKKHNIKNPRKTVICVETGVEYASATEAAKALKINSSHISAVCRGDESRITCGGYHWAFGRVI
jgi:hypothetical protein